MFQIFANKRFVPLRRFCCAVLGAVFACGSLTPPATAQTVPAVILPPVGSMVQTTAAYLPVTMLGLTVRPEDPLQLDFIIDGGQTGLTGEGLRPESAKLINYFLTALTLPEDQLWVNLSPYEKDRIIPDTLSRTEMGRDMLAQDYLLKQLTASLMYPEDELGRRFWDRIIQESYQRYGTTDLPASTFNKIWIIPEYANVYKRDGSVFVVDSHLSVMLEEDYLAAAGHSGETPGDADVLDEATKELIREIMIPAIEREINTGENFAQLRQIFNSMILAVWYKKNLKESLLGQVYADRQLVKGVDHVDPGLKQEIYDRYLAAFRKGVFDYVREDLDPVSHEPVPRKYFSGGVAAIDQAQIAEVDGALPETFAANLHDTFTVRVNLTTIGGDPDAAELAEERDWSQPHITASRDRIESLLAFEASLNRFYPTPLTGGWLESESDVIVTRIMRLLETRKPRVITSDTRKFVEALVTHLLVNSMDGYLQRTDGLGNRADEFEFTFDSQVDGETLVLRFTDNGTAPAQAEDTAAKQQAMRQQRPRFGGRGQARSYHLPFLLRQLGRQVPVSLQERADGQPGTVTELRVSLTDSAILIDGGDIPAFKDSEEVLADMLADGNLPLNVKLWHALEFLDRVRHWVSEGNFVDSDTLDIYRRALTLVEPPRQYDDRNLLRAESRGGLLHDLYLRQLEVLAEMADSTQRLLLMEPEIMLEDLETRILRAHPRVGMLTGTQYVSVKTKLMKLLSDQNRVQHIYDRIATKYPMREYERTARTVQLWEKLVPGDRDLVDYLIVLDKDTMPSGVDGMALIPEARTLVVSEEAFMDAGRRRGDIEVEHVLTEKQILAVTDAITARRSINFSQARAGLDGLRERVAPIFTELFGEGSPVPRFAYLRPSPTALVVEMDNDSLLALRESSTREITEKVAAADIDREIDLREEDDARFRQLRELLQRYPEYIAINFHDELIAYLTGGVLRTTNVDGLLEYYRRNYQNALYTLIDATIADQNLRDALLQEARTVLSPLNPRWSKIEAAIRGNKALIDRLVDKKASLIIRNVTGGEVNLDESMDEVQRMLLEHRAYREASHELRAVLQFIPPGKMHRLSALEERLDDDIRVRRSTPTLTESIIGNGTGTLTPGIATVRGFARTKNDLPLIVQGMGQSVWVREHEVQHVINSGFTLYTSAGLKTPGSFNALWRRALRGKAVADEALTVTDVLREYLPEGRVPERTNVGRFQIVHAPWRTSPDKPDNFFEHVVMPFDERQFFFGAPAQPDTVDWRFDEDTVFWEGQINGTGLTFIEQRWPYALNHFLIVPQRGEHRPQVLNEQDVRLMMDIARSEPLPGFRLAFNSLKAGASINHLHLHGLTVPGDTALEQAGLTTVARVKDVIVSRVDGYGAKGLFFTGETVTATAAAAFDYIHDLQQADIAHAVIATPRGMYVMPVHGNVITSYGMTWSFYELMGYIVNADAGRDLSWVREEHILQEMRRVALTDKEFRATYQVRWGEEDIAPADVAMTAAEHDEQRANVARIYAGMADNFNVTTGQPMFRDSERVAAMAGMFPVGPDGERRPVETDIYSVALMQLPQAMRDWLRDVLVADWLQIFTETDEDIDHFIPERDTYHISVSVVQDLAARPDEAVGVLGRPDEGLTEDQRRRITENLRRIIASQDQVTLAPVGARLGPDGTLIFVFEYDPVLYEIRAEAVDAVRAQNAAFTGRPKPMVHVTLSRTLNNPTVTPGMAEKIARFRDRYASVKAADMGLEGPVAVSELEFSHEKRWMHTEIGASEVMPLGGSDQAELAQFHPFDLLGLIDLDGQRLKAAVEAQEDVNAYDAPLDEELARLGFTREMIIEEIVSKLEQRRTLDRWAATDALEHILREVLENAVDAFMQRADFDDEFMFGFDVRSHPRGTVIRFLDNGTPLFVAETSEEKRAQKKVFHNRYGGKHAGMTIIRHQVTANIDKNAEVQLIDLNARFPGAERKLEFFTMLEILLPDDGAVLAEAPVKSEPGQLTLMFPVLRRLKIKEFDKGSQTRVFSTEAWDYVLKVLPAEPNGVFVIDNYERFRPYMGGLVPAYQIVRLLDTFGLYLEEAVVMEKISGPNLFDDIRAAYEAGDMTAVDRVLGEFTTLLQEIYDRGLLMPDVKLVNFKKHEGHYQLLDAGIVLDPAQFRDGRGDIETVGEFFMQRHMENLRVLGAVGGYELISRYRDAMAAIGLADGEGFLKKVGEIPEKMTPAPMPDIAAGIVRSLHALADVPAEVTETAGAEDSAVLSETGRAGLSDETPLEDLGFSRHSERVLRDHGLTTLGVIKEQHRSGVLNDIPGMKSPLSKVRIEIDGLMLDLISGTEPSLPAVAEDFAAEAADEVVRNEIEADPALTRDEKDQALLTWQSAVDMLRHYRNRAVLSLPPKFTKPGQRGIVMLGHLHGLPYESQEWLDGLRYLDEARNGTDPQKWQRHVTRWEEYLNRALDVQYAGLLQVIEQDYERVKTILTEMTDIRLAGVEYSVKEFRDLMPEAEQMAVFLPQLLRRLNFQSPEKRAQQLMLFTYGPLVYAKVTGQAFMRDVELVPIDNHFLKTSVMGDVRKIDAALERARFSLSPDAKRSYQADAQAIIDRRYRKLRLDRDQHFALQVLKHTRKGQAMLVSLGNLHIDGVDAILKGRRVMPRAVIDMEEWDDKAPELFARPVRTAVDGAVFGTIPTLGGNDALDLDAFVLAVSETYQDHLRGAWNGSLRFYIPLSETRRDIDDFLVTDPRDGRQWVYLAAQTGSEAGKSEAYLLRVKEATPTKIRFDEIMLQRATGFIPVQPVIDQGLALPGSAEVIIKQAERYMRNMRPVMLALLSQGIAKPKLVLGAARNKFDDDMVFLAVPIVDPAIPPSTFEGMYVGMRDNERVYIPMHAAGDRGPHVLVRLPRLIKMTKRDLEGLAGIMAAQTFIGRRLGADKIGPALAGAGVSLGGDEVELDTDRVVDNILALDSDRTDKAWLRQDLREALQAAGFVEDDESPGTFSDDSAVLVEPPYLVGITQLQIADVTRSMVFDTFSGRRLGYLSVLRALNDARIILNRGKRVDLKLDLAVSNLREQSGGEIEEAWLRRDLNTALRSIGVSLDQAVLSEDGRYPPITQDDFVTYFKKASWWGAVIDRLEQFRSDGLIHSYGFTGSFSRGQYRLGSSKDLDIALVLRGEPFYANRLGPVVDFIDDINSDPGIPVHITLTAFGPSYRYSVRLDVLEFDLVRQPEVVENYLNAGHYRGDRFVRIDGNTADPQSLWRLHSKLVELGPLPEERLRELLGVGDQAVPADVMDAVRRKLQRDEAFSGRGNEHLPVYLREFQARLIRGRIAADREIIGRLLNNEDILTVTDQTPLYNGAPLTVDNPVAWGNDTQIFMQPTRSIHLYPGDLRLKGSGGAYLLKQFADTAYPYNVREFGARARAINFGANEQNLQKEMTAALSFAYLMETLWPTEGAQATNIPLGIKRVKTVSMGGEPYPVDVYFSKLAREDEEARTTMEELLVRQLGSRRAEYPEDTAAAFVAFMRPAQMLDMQGSPLRVGLIRKLLLEDYSAGHDFDVEVRERWQQRGQPLEELPAEEIARLAKQRVDDIFGEIMLDYQPLAVDVTELVAETEGVSPFAILYQATDAYRRRTLVYNARTAERFYRDVVYDLGRYLGALWTVGGRTDGGPIEERNVAIRGNRVVLHDWDEGFVPNRETVGIRIEPSAIRNDFGMMQISTLKTIQQLLGVHDRFADSAQRYFMEGVTAGSRRAMEEILMNPGQDVLNDIDRQMLLNDWRRLTLPRETTTDISDVFAAEFLRSVRELAQQGERVTADQAVLVDPATDTRLISEIEPIEQFARFVADIEDLDTFVEAPLLEAARTLFKKGIRTFWTSANRKDIAEGSPAVLMFLYDELSPRNKLVSHSVGQVLDNISTVVRIPMDETTTVADIHREAMAIVNRFDAQSMDRSIAEIIRPGRDEAVTVEDQDKPPMELRRLAGVAFIFGTGNNATVIDADGNVRLEGGALTELGHNILKKSRTGEWVFTGRETLGAKPDQESGDVSFEDSFSGPNIARRFAQTDWAPAFIKTHVTALPEGFATHTQLVDLVRNVPDEENLRKLRAAGIDVILRTITAAVSDGDAQAISFVNRLGREIGMALAAWLKHYAAENWTQNIVLVSGVGEHFARIEGETDDTNVFIGGIRAGVALGLSEAAKTEGLRHLDEARIQSIARGIRRSTMGWERELLAARFTEEERSQLDKTDATPQDALAVGISLGGTKIGAGLISIDGNILARDEIRWRQRYHESSAGIVEGIVDRIANLLTADTVRNLRKVGIAFAGPVDRDAGVVGTPFKAPNLPFDNYPLRQAIRERLAQKLSAEFGSRVPDLIIDIYNDNVAAAIGEQSRSGRLNAGARDEAMPASVPEQARVFDTVDDVASNFPYADVINLPALAKSGVVLTSHVDRVPAQTSIENYVLKARHAMKIYEGGTYRGVVPLWEYNKPGQLVNIPLERFTDARWVLPLHAQYRPKLTENQGLVRTLLWLYLVSRPELQGEKIVAIGAAEPFRRTLDEMRAVFGDYRTFTEDDFGFRLSQPAYEFIVPVLTAEQQAAVEAYLEKFMPITDDAADGDGAVLSTDKKGGIDFNPANMNLSVEGDDIPLNVSPALSTPLGPIEGIRPVIIQIVPVTNLPLLLGLTDKPAEDMPVSGADLLARDPADRRTLTIAALDVVVR